MIALNEVAMARSEQLRCPKCGGLMNHHADKLVLAAGDEPPGVVDPAFGGIVEETHACPVCGAVASRRAPQDA